MTRKEGLADLKGVVRTCNDLNIQEKSFHLYFYNGDYIIVADSVVDEYGKGKHIKEMIV